MIALDYLDYESTRWKIPAWCTDCEFVQFDDLGQAYCPFNKCEDSSGFAEFRKEHSNLRLSQVFELYWKQLYDTRN